MIYFMARARSALCTASRFTFSPFACLYSQFCFYLIFQPFPAEKPGQTSQPGRYPRVSGFSGRLSRSSVLQFLSQLLPQPNQPANDPFLLQSASQPGIIDSGFQLPQQFSLKHGIIYPSLKQNHLAASFPYVPFRISWAPAAQVLIPLTPARPKSSR